MTANVSCTHIPLPCIHTPGTNTCVIEDLHKAWRHATSGRVQSTNGQLVKGLIESGCSPMRAKTCASQEGYGMTTSPAVFSAYKKQERDRTAILDKDIKICEQCKPGTNTFAYSGSKYHEGCSRIRIDLHDRKMETLDGVLCIGANGKLEYCDVGRFLAVSHVWDHGWRGE